MSSSPARARLFATVLLTAGLCPTLASGSDPAEILAHDTTFQAASEPTWKHLRFKASKLFITMETTVELSSGAPGADVLLRPKPALLDGLRPVSARADRRLTVETSVLGRRSTEIVHFQGDGGQAIQRYKRRFGGSGYSKIQSFLDRGVFLRRAAPAEELGAAEPKSDADLHERLFPRPAEDPCPVVIDPIEIFYLLSAARLEHPGDGFEVCVFSDKTFGRLEAEVTAVTERRADYRLDGADPPEGDVPAIAVALRTAPLAGQTPEETIEVIGLEGDLEVFLDRRHRLPIEICGEHSKMGSVSIRLKEALSAGPSPRTPPSPAP